MEFIIVSSEYSIPANGLPPDKIIPPVNTPMNNESRTRLVRKHKRIATKGGSKVSIPTEFSIKQPPKSFLKKVLAK